MTNQDRPMKSMSESKCYKNRQVFPQDTESPSYNVWWYIDG